MKKNKNTGKKENTLGENETKRVIQYKNRFILPPFFLQGRRKKAEEKKNPRRISRTWCKKKIFSSQHNEEIYSDGFPDMYISSALK